MSAKKKVEAAGLIGRLGRLLTSSKKGGGGGRSGRTRKNRAANKAAAKDAAAVVGSPIAVAAARQTKKAEERAAAARKAKRQAAKNRRSRRTTQKDKAQNLQREGDRATTALKVGTAATLTGAGVGAALAARDGNKNVDRRGRPLKPKANGSKATTTKKANGDQKKDQKKAQKRDPNTTRPSGRAATAASAASEIRSTKPAAEKRSTKPATAESKPKVKYNVGVSRGGVPFAKAFDYYRGQGQKTFSWNGKKYTTELKKEGKADKKKASAAKTADKKPENKAKGFRKFLLGEDGKFGGKRGAIDFLPGKSRPGRKAKDDKKASGKAGGGMMSKKGFSKGGMSKKGYAKGGMSKKGYAKGGMTKKGYAKGGSVRGKPRGVGAAVRGYGKALT